MAVTTAQVQQAYVAFFNRPADLAGLNYWTSSPAASVANLLDAFSKTPEYTSLYSNMNSTQLVNAVYQNLFGRAVESVDALNYWVGLLDKGTVTLGSIAATVADLAITNKTADGTLVSNKVAAATAFTSSLSTASNADSATAYATASSTGLQAVKNWLAAVTSDAATLTNATSATTLNSLLSTVKSNVGSTGSTFTLTDKIGESVVGTAGNDTFKAVVGSTASDSTLHIGDSIDGGAGTDTLNLTLTAKTTIASGVTIKNVEVVNLDVTAIAAGSAADPSFLKSSAYEGVQQLWQVETGSVGTAGTAKFDDVTVAEGVTAGFRGNNVAQSATGDTGGAADVSATVSAATATQKSLSIALDGVGSRSVVEVAATSGKIETVNVSGSVAKDTSTASGLLKVNTTADTLTVNGEFTSGVALAITGTTTKLKTVDLSKSTGGVEINASGLAALETIKGGAGNDKLTVDLGAKLVSVDLGAGNDTLVFTDTASGDGKELSVTLGAGKDTIVTTAVKNVIDTTDLTKGLVTITDFKLGDDTLNLNTAGKVLTAGELATAKGAATLKEAIDSVAAAIGASKSAVFSYGADAYVFINDGTTGGGFADGDGLIKLVGVDATLLSTNQNGGLVL